MIFPRLPVRLSRSRRVAIFLLLLPRFRPRNSAHDPTRTIIAWSRPTFSFSISISAATKNNCIASCRHPRCQRTAIFPRLPVRLSRTRRVAIFLLLLPRFRSRTSSAHDPTRTIAWDRPNFCRTYSPSIISTTMTIRRIGSARTIRANHPFISRGHIIFIFLQYTEWGTRLVCNTLTTFAC
jgi:hypothetical protein